MWAVVLIGVFSVATVSLRLYIVKTSYQIDQSSKILHNAMKEREILNLKLAQSKSPVALRPIARNRFHLDLPHPKQVVRMNSP